jgi:hypothetical protein
MLWGVYQFFWVLPDCVDSIECLIVQVLMGVRQIDLPQLEPRLLAHPPHVLYANLVIRSSVCQPRVPEDPNDLGQSQPRLACTIDERLFFVFPEEGGL